MPILHQQKISSNITIAQWHYYVYNYYGDCYSKYQNEDKKYQCRTVPFKGFVIS